MAISPTIPTSFVPRAPVQGPKRHLVSGNDPFVIIGLSILGLMLLAAGGVFLYNQYLGHERDTKFAAIQSAQKNINQQTIQDFIRLRDRFASANELLTNHVELSELFDVLESITLQNVQYTNLKVVVSGDHSAQLTANGFAKNFNTLAAQSNALAGEKRIRRAIFSGITLNKDNTVSFTLAAELDPSLVIASAGAQTATTAQSLPALPVSGATTTPATTTVRTATSSSSLKVPTPAQAPAPVPSAPQTAGSTTTPKP